MPDPPVISCSTSTVGDLFGFSIQPNPYDPVEYSGYGKIGLDTDHTGEDCSGESGSLFYETRYYPSLGLQGEVMTDLLTRPPLQLSKFLIWDAVQLSPSSLSISPAHGALLAFSLSRPDSALAQNPRLPLRSAMCLASERNHNFSLFRCYLRISTTACSTVKDTRLPLLP